MTSTERMWALIRIQNLVFMKDAFEKVNFEKSQQMTTKVLNSPSVQRVITFLLIEIIHVTTCVFVE